MKKESNNSKMQMHCSFCGKPQSEARKIIAGPGVCICDECVSLCNDVIESETKENTQNLSFNKNNLKPKIYTKDIFSINYDKLKSITRKSSYLKKNELKVTGKDLLDLGVEQEYIGQVLDQLYNNILEGKLKNNRDKIIEYIINNVLPSGYDKQLFNEA